MAKKKFLSTTAGKVLIAALIIAVAAFSTFAIVALSSESLLDDNTTTPTTATEYTIVIHDFLDPDNDEDMDDAVTVAWYGVDISGLTDDEIEDLTWTDFSLEEADDKTFDPKDDYVYIALVNGSDVCPKYYATSSLTFQGLLPVWEDFGTYDIYCVNESEDLSMLAFSSEAFTTTVNETDYREWTLMMNCLDGSEGTSANLTSKQGYESYYDPTIAGYQGICLEFEFNVTTASSSYVTILTPNVAYDEVVSGNTLYILLKESFFTGSNSIDFKFSTGLSSTFEASKVTVSFGSVASNSDLDYQ